MQIARARSFSDVSLHVCEFVVKQEEEEKKKQEDVTVCMSQEECPICLDEFQVCRPSSSQQRTSEEVTAVFTAECGHKFHYNCLLENVNHDEANSDKCPICRRAQKDWPQHSKGLAKAHPYCTNCGVKGTGGQFCESCGTSLAHTPTAQERARAAAARNNVVVECPACRIRCLVSTSSRGTLQCPNGHLFQVRMPNNNVPSFGSSSNSSRQQSTAAPPRTTPNIRQCPTCHTRVQMPPGCQAGHYMCPHGHTFYHRPQ